VGTGVEKYRKPTRILHWIITAAFVILFLTGLILFVPQLVFLANHWTRLVHRIAAGIFIVAPLVYLVFNWHRSWEGIKGAFTWGKDDLGWLKAAPRYYFLNDEEQMPPQPHMNTGQKMWWFIVIVFGTLFAITGLIMSFKSMVPFSLFQWAVILHDVAFVVAGLMMLVHIYLGVFHPMMTESWKAITTGKVSEEYAKSHHGKWYEELIKSQKAKAVNSEKAMDNEEVEVSRNI
jgi:formate dehydrogenase subunit gamma